MTDNTYDPSELEKCDDETLERWLAGWQEDIAFHRERIARNEGYVKQIQAELSRRQIDKTPIKVGDKILVTKEMLPKYAPYTTKPFIATIEAVDSFGGGEIKAWVGRGGATMEDALVMRKAYLDKYNAAMMP